MKRALIINEGYSNNLGDQAIKKSMVVIFKDNGYKTSFLYFTKPKLNKLPETSYLNKASQKTSQNKFIGFVMSYFYFFYWFIKNKTTIINNLKNGNYDIVVIGGGQLIISSNSNSLSGFSIYMYWFTRLIKKYTNSKCYLIAVGSSVKFNKTERKLFAKSFERFDGIWVRDKFSQKNIKKLFNVDSALMPDIAFYNKQVNKIISKPIDKIALVGVTNYQEVFVKYNPSSSISKHDYFDNLYEIVKAYQIKENEVKLFYTTKLDGEECLYFKEYIFDKYRVSLKICDINDINDLVNEFDNAKHVYAGRMHALILALKSHCILTPQLLSQKLKSFNNDYITSDRSTVELSNEIENQLSSIFK